MGNPFFSLNPFVRFLFSRRLFGMAKGVPHSGCSSLEEGLSVCRFLGYKHFSSLPLLKSKEYGILSCLICDRQEEEVLKKSNEGKLVWGNSRRTPERTVCLLRR